MTQKYVKFMLPIGEYITNKTGEIRVESVYPGSIVNINGANYVIEFHPDDIITATREDKSNANPIRVEEAVIGEYNPDLAAEEDDVPVNPIWCSVKVGGKRKNRSNRILKLRKPVKWGGRKTRKQKRSTKKRRTTRRR